MDRLRLALVLLLAFVACTGAAILITGMPPATDPGVLPWLVQVAGYVCGVAAGALVLAHDPGGGRTSPLHPVGLLLVAALVALVLLDAATTATDSGGASIGAGIVRLLLLAGIAVAAVRLARAVAGARRS